MVPGGRTGAGRATEEPDGAGRAVVTPVGPVETLLGTLPVGVGRIGAGRTTEGLVLGGRAGITPAGLDVSVARGTTRFGTGGSILDDEDEDALVIGGRSDVALNGGLVTVIDVGVLLVPVALVALEALAALIVASAASVAANSFRAFSFLRSPFDFFCFFLGGSRPLAIASSASSC